MRRWVLAVGLGVLLLVLFVAAAWHDVSTARGQLNGARLKLSAIVDDPQSLRSSEGRTAAIQAMDEATARLDSAHQRVTGSIPLRLVRPIPGLSRQRAAVLQLIDDAKVGTAASKALLTTLESLTSATSVTDGAVPLDGLSKLEAAIGDAGRNIRVVRRSASGLWPSLADARERLNAVATRSSRSLLDGAAAIGATRTLMGSDGPRRYLVAVQNNAEMRDQGMVLSFAVVRFEAGRLIVERTGPITELKLDTPVELALPGGTQQIFGYLQPLMLWQNTNATADWPLSARSMAAMYTKAGGQDVDGVIALDVPGLAAILRIIGSVPNPAGGEAITADNASRILLNDYYQGLARGESGLRKERLAEVASAVITRLTTGTHDAVALGRELGAAAGGGHFRLWSRNQAEEKVFRQTGLGGGPAERRADRTFHFAVQNGSASKLDYFQRQRVHMDVYVTEVGTAVVRTSLTVVNTAPKNAQASYQMGGPGGVTQQVPGEYVARVYFWGPSAAKQYRAVRESGLQLNFTAGIVPPEESKAFVFESAIPRAVRAGRLDLRLVPQASLVPAELTVRLHAPGWSVDGEATISRPWDRTITVGWDLER